MPMIRAEQVLSLTLKDLQIAEDAGIKQSKIEDWQSDASGWISQGIIKPVTTAELPVWDGSQAGQFYYDVNTNEIFIGISTAPYYALIAGDGGSSTGDTVLKDRIIVVKEGPDAENWTGADETDLNGTASIFSLDTYKVSADGSNLMVYLNGVLQERGSGNDYILYSEMEALIDDDGTPQATDKIQFNYNLEGPDQKVSAIISVDEYLVNYATKAFVESILMDTTAHDHNGSGSPQLDFNEAITASSLSNIIHNIVPAEGSSLDLGSDTRKFNAVYASEGHFDASTIYLGGIAISGANDTLTVSVDGGATTKEVAVSGDTTAPAALTAGTGQEVVLESEVGITAKGDILPDMTGAIGFVSTRNLGSETQKFDSIYADEVFIGASSLYVNGKKVIQDVSNEMTFATDTDQSLVFKTSSTIPGTGNGNIVLQSDNEFNVTAIGGMEWTVGSSEASKHINFANSSAGGNITFSATGINSQIQAAATDKVALTATEIELNGITKVNGDFYVNGTTTTVNTQTISIADNIMLLNNDVTGVPTQDAGIEIERGAENNYQILFDESSDTFKIGDTGSLQSVATREDAPYSTGFAYWDLATSSFKTNAAVRFNGTDLEVTGIEVGTGSDGGINFENNKHHITSNDGGGNFNIRIGNKYDNSLGHIAITEAGYAFHEVWEQNNGTWNFNITPAPQPVGEVAVFTSSLILSPTAVTTSKILNANGGISGELTGNASTATKLATARTIDITGDITATAVAFDGSANIAISAAVNNDSHSHTNTTLPAKIANNTGAGFVKYNGTIKVGGGFYGGTTAPTNTNRLNYDGYLYATRVYNAVYNDIAEFMPAVDKGEPGMVMVQTKDGLKPCEGRGDGAVFGVYSDTYGYALGADDAEHKVPVGISGRIWVWVEEPCAIGELLITSDKRGFGTVKRAEEDGMGKVFAKVMEEKTDSKPQRVEALILMA